MTKTNDIEKKLDREIKKREIITEAFATELENLHIKLENESKLSNKFISDHRNRIHQLNEATTKLEEMKADLLGYTLRIITTIVALLGIILTITALTLTSYTPDDNFLWFCIGVIGFFAILLLSWFILWIKKEEIFKYVDKPEKKTKKIPYVNWLFFVVISFFIILILITLGVIFLIDSPIYWNYFIQPLGIVLIALIINFSPQLSLLEEKLLKASWIKLFLILIAVFIFEMILFSYFKFFWTV